MAGSMLWLPAPRRVAAGFPAGGAAGFASASSQSLSIADNAALSMSSAASGGTDTPLTIMG